MPPFFVGDERRQAGNRRVFPPLAAIPIWLGQRCYRPLRAIFGSGSRPVGDHLELHRTRCDSHRAHHADGDPRKQPEQSIGADVVATSP